MFDLVKLLTMLHTNGTTAREMKVHVSVLRLEQSAFPAIVAFVTNATQDQYRPYTDLFGVFSVLLAPINRPITVKWTRGSQVIISVVLGSRKFGVVFRLGIAKIQIEICK